MKTLRFYKLLIVVLILINITTISFFWLTSKRPGPPGKNELVELLDLQGQTKTTILAMQDDHFTRKHALVQKSRDLHEQLFQSFNDETKDSTAVAQLIDRIVENQRETEQMTFDYFKEVSKLCTPEQREKLQELIHDVLRRAGGPPPKK
jgi:Spy/CpxP family protein refolding chaperone